MANKVHLIVKKDKVNKYFYCGKNNYRLQLCGDSRKDWFYIKQLAEELWKENFMRDLRDIFALAEQRGIALFTLYVLPELHHWKISD
jgi:hypothetical protein